MSPPPVIFNPNPRIQSIPLPEGKQCLVIDDALLNPEVLVQLAVDEYRWFEPPVSGAYPGLQLPLNDYLGGSLGEFFLRYARTPLGARKLRLTNCRLTLVTVPPEQLTVQQRLCHRDGVALKDEFSLCASVLYLFNDPSLGGTNLYWPKKSKAEITALVRAVNTMTDAEFCQIYPVPNGYFTESNEYFEKICSVEPKWNRMVMYDGNIFHSGNIVHPEKMTADPRTGRLTLNGFFTCTRRAV